MDYLSKLWLIGYLKQIPGMMAELNPFLDIVYVWNYGISFGILREYYQYSNYGLLVVNSLIVAYICYLLWRCCKLHAEPVSVSQETLKQVQGDGFSIWMSIGYSLIIGGALGNIVDRLIYGAVFDFIHLHYKDYSFPIFNLADSFISIGVAVIVLSAVRVKK